jgi:hypothetical protein
VNKHHKELQYVDLNCLEVYLKTNPKQEISVAIGFAEGIFKMQMTRNYE